MEIKINAWTDNYDGTEVKIKISRTESPKTIWLEIDGRKVSVNTEDLLRAVSTFMPSIADES